MKLGKRLDRASGTAASVMASFVCVWGGGGGGGGACVCVQRDCLGLCKASGQRVL